jgi:hypothetical protein
MIEWPKANGAGLALLIQINAPTDLGDLMAHERILDRDFGRGWRDSDV